MAKKHLFFLFLTFFAFETVHGQGYVSFSSESLYQGDAFLIKSEKEANTAVFISKTFQFAKTETGDWVAFIGIGAKKTPGIYTLTINFSDGTKYAKKIKIAKKNFIQTKLLITNDLAQKGYTAKSIANDTSITSKVFYKSLSYYSPSAFFSKPFIFPLLEIKDVGAYGNIRKGGGISLQHLGTDLEAKEGTSVFASNDGVVCFEGKLENYGNTIVINHGFGIFSLYLHLSEFKISLAQIVKRGDVIALSGNTGYSIEPHLHFSVHIRGESIDPLMFVEDSMNIK